MILSFLQLNIQYTNILPPNDIVIKGVADYLKDKNAEDIEGIAADVFKDSGYNIKEGISRLKESVNYYKELIASVDADEQKSKGMY